MFSVGILLPQRLVLTNNRPWAVATYPVERTFTSSISSWQRSVRRMS